MKHLPAFLALCLPIYLFAQGFGSFSHDQPYFAKDSLSGSASPVLLLNSKYWWVHTDLTNNLTVTNWVERISGFPMTNGAPASRPTNSSLGVHFVGNTLLTNTGISMNGEVANNPTNSIWFIIQQDVANTANFMCADPANDAGLLFSSGTLFYVDGNFINGGTMTANHMVDVLITSRGGPFISFYTNGVFSASSSTTFISGDAGYKSLGSGLSGFFRGYVRELAIWATNTLTSTDAQILHEYATNTYNYTP